MARFGATIEKWTTTCFSLQEAPILREKPALLETSLPPRAPRWYEPENIHCLNMRGYFWIQIFENVSLFVAGGLSWSNSIANEGRTCWVVQALVIIVKLRWWRWVWWQGWSNRIEKVGRTCWVIQALKRCQWCEKGEDCRDKDSWKYQDNDHNGGDVNHDYCGTDDAEGDIFRKAT